MARKIKDPKRFLFDMHRQGWKIIYLQRTNILRQTLSNLMAQHRQSYHHKSSDGPLKLPKIQVDCDTLIERMMKERARYLHKEQELLRDLPNIGLIYEEDLLRIGNHQKTLDKLLNYLGVPPVPAKTNLVRTSKDNLADIIENFHEVSQVIVNTKYANLLK